MPEGDAAHPSRRSGRLLRRLTAGLVVLVLAATVATYELDLGTRWFGLVRPSPVTQPALVLPPPGLSLPQAERAAPVAAAVAPRAVDGAAVRRAVASLVRAKKLGRHVVVAVAQASDGTMVYRHGSGVVTPASTLKLLTTVAALDALGPAHRFTTSVVTGGGGGGSDGDGSSSGPVVLVGGGDPLLARAPGVPGGYPHRADLTTLARSTAEKLRAQGRVRVRLGYDTSLFTGPAVDPHWEPDYVPDDVVSPISPLWVDEGRESPDSADRVADPALAAAQVFARALERRGIQVVGKPVPRVAATAEAGRRVLAQVRGARLDQVVQHVLQVSDNEGAEVLARQVAVARGMPASFSGGAAAVQAQLRTLGVPTGQATTYDGSGLSRQDRLAAATLLAVIRVASSSAHPDLSSAVADLPVAGFSGSLTDRFDTGDPEGLGAVRAKTGTLTGVHGLAGSTVTADGALLTFVAIADKVKPVNTLDARETIDRLAAALAGCRCAAP